MRQTIKKWGNSLALRLPASVAEAARLSEDQEVDVRVDDQGKIVVESAYAIDDFDYEDFVSSIRRDEVPALVDIGDAVGSELGGPSDPYGNDERRLARVAD